MNLKETLYRLRVRTGTLGLLLTLVFSKPTFDYLLAGIGLTLFGLFLRAWACGHLKKEAELTTSGPYKYSRNPLYLANLIIGTGVVIGSQSWFVAIYFIVYSLVFYPIIIHKEKEKMMHLFPEQYKEYQKNTPLFAPRIKLSLSGENKPFSFELYKKNKEPRALIGGILFWSVMAAKMLFF